MTQTPEFEQVAAASRALRFDVTKAAYAVMGLIRSGAWQRFVNPKGELVEHAHFVEFVAAPALRGLNTTVDELRHICARDRDAADALDQVLAETPVKPVPNRVDNVNAVRPVGNSRDRSMRHLREHSPELHRRVLDGELSAHAAMVEGGFRPKTATVRLDDMERAAATLSKKLNSEERRRLAALLAVE